MPAKYLLLVQLSGCPCEVVFYDSDRQTREVKFSGGRCAAKRFLRELRALPEFIGVPAFSQKKGRKGHPPDVVELPLNAKMRSPNKA